MCVPPAAKKKKRFALKTYYFRKKSTGPQATLTSALDLQQSHVHHRAQVQTKEAQRSVHVSATFGYAVV